MKNETLFDASKTRGRIFIIYRVSTPQPNVPTHREKSLMNYLVGGWLGAWWVASYDFNFLLHDTIITMLCESV